MAQALVLFHRKSPFSWQRLEIHADRRKGYRCVETLFKLGSADEHRGSLQHLYGSATVETAEALPAGEQRFFAIEAPGMNVQGCDMHQRLLAAYGKLHH